MILKTAGFFLAAVMAVSAAPQSPVAVPPDGRALLERMHAAYDGKWFKTMTFVQKTTMVRPDGSQTEQTWFESVKSPDLLRIDTGPLVNGNGSLNKPDSVTVMRGGKVAQTRPTGNPFLPFVTGIYTQPVDQTLAQMAPQKFFMGVVRASEYKGRGVFIVGASRSDDLTSPQFWVDAERLVPVRVILSTGPGTALDCVLEDYIKSGGSWVATKVSMSVDGKLRQLEEYSDVKTNVELAPDLFDPARWQDAKHWAAGIR